MIIELALSRLRARKSWQAIVSRDTGRGWTLLPGT